MIFFTILSGIIFEWFSYYSRLLLININERLYMKTLLSLKIVLPVIALCFTLNSCGSGDSSSSGDGSGASSGTGNGGYTVNTQLTPPTGDGLLLAGTWTLNYGESVPSAPTTLTLNQNGTFRDVFTGGSATGFWTSSDGISILLHYSNTNEYPPTGSCLSGTASADRNSMSGSYLYINQGVGIDPNETWTTTR